MADTVSPAIQRSSELRAWFFQQSTFSHGKETMLKGLYVDSRTRKEIMTNEDQGKIVLTGIVRTIEFENMGGGVYRAYVAF